MNICQFWVIDYILKQKPAEKFPIRIDEDDEDLYGLVGGLEHSYDEDGDDLDDLNNQDSSFDHNRTSRPLSERLDLEEEDIASKHQDSEYSQFPSGSNRRL